MSGYTFEEEAIGRIQERSGHSRVVTRDADSTADLLVLTGALQSVLRIHHPEPLSPGLRAMTGRDDGRSRRRLLAVPDPAGDS